MACAKGRRRIGRIRCWDFPSFAFPLTKPDPPRSALLGPHPSRLIGKRRPEAYPIRPRRRMFRTFPARKTGYSVRGIRPVVATRERARIGSRQWVALGVLLHGTEFDDEPDENNGPSEPACEDGEEQLGNPLARVPCVEIVNPEGPKKNTQEDEGQAGSAWQEVSGDTASDADGGAGMDLYTTAGAEAGSIGGHARALQIASAVRADRLPGIDLSAAIRTRPDSHGFSTAAYPIAVSRSRGRFPRMASLPNADLCNRGRGRIRRTRKLSGPRCVGSCAGTRDLSLRCFD